MSRTNDFFNLGELLGTSDPRDAVRVRAVFDRALADVAAIPGGGGVLYAPRVPRGQLWVDVSTRPLVIPERVTLELAPGVVLVPLVTSGAAGPNAFIEVAGAFDAPLGTVIATPGWLARHGGGADSARVGTIRFTSRAMERVHPEWWGADDASDPARASDSEALDAALRAALHDRVSGARSLRPLVIELRGTYRLARPWNLRPGSAPGAGLELRGAPASAEVPTFMCAAGFPGNPSVQAWTVAMVDARDLEGVTFEDLRFEGDGAVGACLSLRTTRLSVQERGHHLRRCDFAGARRLVQVEATGAGGGGGGLLGGAADDLRIEHCAFRPSVPSDGTMPWALHVTATGAGVEVRGCRFEGDAAVMIHAVGGALSVTSCHFANGLVPESLRDGSRTADLHGAGPEGGLDVFLDGPPQGAPARVYAQDCYSRSTQFLATCRGAAQDAGGDSVIVALHHVNTIANNPGNPDPFRHLGLREKWVIPVDKLGPKDGAGRPHPPAVPIEPPIPLGPPVPGPVQVHPPAPIHWRIDRSASSNLLLTGCRFDQLRTEPAVLAFAGSGRVGNLGVLNAPIRVEDPGAEMLATVLAAR